MSKYKLSKYTYITQKGEDTIFFNAKLGMKSLVKIKGSWNASSLKDINMANNMLLKTKGHIIDINENENDDLEKMFLSFQNKKQLSLILLPNETCNFRCEYCYETLNHKKMNCNTIQAIINYVSNNIKSFDSLYVSWYGGEPLLSVDIITTLSDALIKICKLNKKYYFASMTTNGYALDLKTFQKLKKCKIFSYQISIDGYRKNHNKQRPLHNGDGTYDKILNNLIAIKENVKSKMYKFILRTNCSKNTFENFDLYLDDLIQHFGNDERFQLLLRPVMNWGGERIQNMEKDLIQIINLSDFFELIINKDPTGKLSYFTGLIEPMGSACYAGYKNHLTINSSGDIYKCTCDLSDNMNSKLGFINTNQEFKIDQEKTLNWLNNFTQSQSECSTCFFSPICLYDFCPGKRILRSSQSLHCPFDKYILDYILIIASKKIKTHTNC